jgi:hypothetical protein
VRASVQGERIPLRASGVVEKAYGTVLAALAWIDYIVPVLGETTGPAAHP